MIIRFDQLIGILVICFASIGMYFYKAEEDRVLEYIKRNPDKSALKLIENGLILAEQNPDKIMPLASTKKLIIAVEFAEQASNKLIDPYEKILLTELEKYYVPNTDGGAHPAWLNSIDASNASTEALLRDIAIGMISHSSNANTEWLCEKLGLDNINNRLVKLGVQKHTDIYYIVSAMFVGKQLFPQYKGSALASKLKKLTLEEYINATEKIHVILKTNSNYKNDLGDMEMSIQKVWSDNLSGSTVQEYVEIMRKINSRTYFKSQVQEYIEELIEFPHKDFKHLGMKGGSTAFILTKALYATDNDGNKIELAYFFNDLTQADTSSLRREFSKFGIKVLRNERYRKSIEEAFKD